MLQCCKKINLVVLIIHWLQIKLKD